MPPELAAFVGLRPRLLRLAYRMLGSVAEAEDVVQETWLRWQGAGKEDLRDPEAFLIRIATRLCLDALRSARRQRETYVGPWLPEPLVDPFAPVGPSVADELTLTMMLVLERLSPAERAAFLLHDVFGLDFAEVARSLEREEAACRQLASRARRQLQAARPRFPVAPEAGLRLAEAFFAASRSGDASALRQMLAAEAVAVTDGGGRRRAALNPILGPERIIAFFAGLARKGVFTTAPPLHVGMIDGLPGFITREPDAGLQATALQPEGESIAAIYIQRNPDKLRHLLQ
ncbi:sigma-70 family RNA polymerase sigma factor [Roseomonas sp. E05]|uniref:sigma-70 family RNA polymerase sigma factor n=1 Tax=Roseomonas sp. E05 TaxID=3046310 RepID=UPI0024BB9F7C|nr:sigma-70 family RNA polymerase sigma factor [Roseomonas sp. E05]MDJ0387673.1 sigma-70 family RNA polymerase sigma factor [Roseomonas sp. E05]